MSPLVRKLFFALCLSPLAAVCAPGAVFAADAGTGYANVVLSRLPYRKSRAYSSLHALAGRPGVKTLGMTKSEAWSVPSSRVERLLEEADAHCVPAMRITDANPVLVPMAGGTGMSGAPKEMMDRSMAPRAAMSMRVMALPDSRAVEMALGAGMGENDQPSSIVIPLSDATTVTAERIGVERTSDGEGYVWSGRVKGTADPVTLAWRPSGLSGTVEHGGRIFTIKPMGEGMQGVVEMAPDRMPGDHAPIGLDKMRRMNMRTDPLVTYGDASMMRPGSGKDDGTAKDEGSRVAAPNVGDADAGRRDDIEITVLAAYTEEAARHYADIVQDLIAFAIDGANQSFKMSRIENVKLRLVHAYQTDYAEKGGHFDHLFAFADKGDGLMEEVHALRDRHGADVAVLIVDDPAGCGLSAKVAGEADDAFAVVDQMCAASMHSFAHEIGHIIGARHDLALDDGKEPFPFGHGFVNGASWRTMMSYKDSCGGCPRIPIWSNPNVRIDGVAAGDAVSNNALVIEKRALAVSRFRTSNEALVPP